MAQIIKYANGGSTTKYGVFTKDGVVYDNINDQFLTELQHYSPEVADALRAGKNISYNSETNSIVGDVDFQLKGEKQEKKLERNGRPLEGNRLKRARRHISNLAQFDPTIHPNQSKIRELDLTDTINLSYGEKDTLGNRQFLNSADNTKAKQRINWLLNHINDKYDNYKFYDNKFESIEDADKYIESVRDILSSDDFQNRLNSGRLNENDLAILNSFGIFDNTSEKPKTEKEKQQEEEDKIRSSWKEKNWDYDKWKNLINVDTNTGVVTIKDPEFAEAVGSDNIWLNNEWKKLNMAYADYIPDDSGLFVINGKLYRGDDKESLSKNQTFLNWVKENRETGGNSSIIKQYHTPGTISQWSSFSTDSEGNPIWSPFFKNNQFGKDVSGYYERFEGDPLIIDYFPEYNSENLEMFDYYGHPLQNLAQRVYIDPKTKQVIENYNPVLKEQKNNSIIETYYSNENRPTAFNSYYSLGGNGGYQEVANSGNYDNTGVGTSLYYNPKTNLYYWYDINPGGDDMTINSKLPKGEDSMGTYAWNIDNKLGEYLKTHPEVITNSEVRNAINNTIQNVYLTSGSFRKDVPYFLNNYPELAAILKELYNSQTLGKDKRVYSGSGGNRDIRSITDPIELERRGLAYRIPINKNGGIIKYQIGGVASNRNTSIKGTRSVRESDRKQRAAGVDKTIGDGTKLNASDKAELAALVTDAAALGATFVPVYGNALGAGLGAVSSFTNFGVDVTRDGLDLGDFGNLAVNLGLDIATLIPGLGTAGKAAKIAKAMKKSKALAKWVGWAGMAASANASIAGITTAWNNIQDGSWTIKDIRTILNGIRGFSNIKKTTGSATKKGSLSTEMSLKPINNKELPEIKLKKSEVDAIEALPKDKRSEKLQDIIIGKLGKAKTDNVTNILEEYGIKESTTRGFNWKKPWNWNKSTDINTNQFKFDRQPGVYRNPSEMSWYNLNKRAAIRDAKTNRLNPYFKDYAIPITNTVEGTTINAFKKAPIANPVYGGLMLDYGVFNDTTERKPYYNIENPPIFYKKGGKVIKAFNGTKMYYDFTDQWNSDFGSQLGKADYIGTSGGPRIKKQLVKPIITKSTNKQTSTPTINYDFTDQWNAEFADKFGEADYIGTESNIHENNINKGLTLFDNSNVLDDLSEIKYDANANLNTRKFGSSSGNFLNRLNPDTLLGVTDYITKSIAQNKLKEAGYKSAEAMGKSRYKSYVHRQNVPYFQGDLERARNINRENILNRKFVHSDPRLMMTYKLGQSNALNESDSYYLNAASNRLTEHQKTGNEVNFDNKVRFAQTADNNASADRLIDAAKAQVDQSYIAQKVQSLANLIYEGRQNLARDLQEKQQAESAIKQLQAQDAFVKSLADKYQRYYNQLTTDQRKEYNDLEDYVYQTDLKGWQALRNQAFANVPINNYNEGIPHGVWRPRIKEYQSPYKYVPQTNPLTEVTRMKKGGNIKRYRDVDEQHYLDQQKATNKAINDLNNNIVKLFLKMMS